MICIEIQFFLSNASVVMFLKTVSEIAKSLLKFFLQALGLKAFYSLVYHTYNVAFLITPFQNKGHCWCGTICYWTILMWEILLLDFFAVGDSDAGLSS